MPRRGILFIEITPTATRLRKNRMAYRKLLWSIHYHSFLYYEQAAPSEPTNQLLCIPNRSDSYRSIERRRATSITDKTLHAPSGHPGYRNFTQTTTRLRRSRREYWKLRPSLYYHSFFYYDQAAPSQLKSQFNVYRMDPMAIGGSNVEEPIAIGYDPSTPQDNPDNNQEPRLLLNKEQSDKRSVATEA